MPDRKKLNNQNPESLTQIDNPWSNNDLLPEEELVLYKQKFEKIKK